MRFSADWTKLNSRSAETDPPMAAALDFACEWRIWHKLVVELDAEHVGLSFQRLEVNSELGIAFGLDVIGNILAVDRDDDFQISSSSLRGVDGEIDWFTNKTVGYIGDHNLGKHEI